MKILAITTSSNICSVAILEDTHIIIQKNSNDKTTHSQKLMPIIEESLKECNLTLADFDLFACSIGPGSFTGVRIGVSTIKAFCDVTNIKAVGISSLEGLAYNTLNSNFYDSNSIVCSLIDAKNDNVYCGIYKKENNSFIELEDLCAKNINDILDILKKYSSSSIIFVGDGATEHSNLILEKFSNCIFLENELNNESSTNIGKAAFYKYKQGIYGNSNSISPLYLRKSQAERNLDEKI